jgi:hypothetical protein
MRVVNGAPFSLTRSDLTFVYSLGQLSIHFSRASEALRIWGHGEGEDLSVSAPYSGHSFAIVSEAPFRIRWGPLPSSY